MATAAELLAETEAAISACLKSQAYTVRGRSQQMAQLKELRELRRSLLDEVQAEASPSMSGVGRLVDPT